MNIIWFLRSVFYVNDNWFSACRFRPSSAANFYCWKKRISFVIRLRTTPFTVVITARCSTRKTNRFLYDFYIFFDLNNFRIRILYINDIFYFDSQYKNIIAFTDNRYDLLIKCLFWSWDIDILTFRHKIWLTYIF